VAYFKFGRLSQENTAGERGWPQLCYLDYKEEGGVQF